MIGRIEKFRNWIYARLVWVLLTIAILLLYLSKSAVFSDELNLLVEKIGIAVLSSGVFAAVLKSLQFQGIFKKEIEDVILSDKFIEHRRDKEKLWISVSKAIYKKKFPKISKQLNKIILDEYFPKKRMYYYDDYRATITIHKLEDNGVIQFTQTIYYKVVMQTGVKKANIIGNNTIDKPDNDSSTKNINKREYFKIDGVDRLNQLDMKKEETEFETITTYSTTVKDKPCFTVEMKDYREYNIFEDNIKILRTSAITNEMNVSVTYPKNMNVQFFNVGVINEFEKVNIDHENCISRKYKDGLILPNQGFGISFGIINKVK
ncbi:hypothetical protein [Tenacibaculum finnmarkense]|uniref:hypothetical protein n=1 Tax=Tenacibaculum finnmarkense TaxID=2781243 RepID=UPI001EFAC97A|nr:hypothetical protein [Tenacibaculum finnmarkense]MCG8731630.1 hypothetical protein [Tenacibaculum finnmarkense]MCG8752948.1 hypothetical protein [Tenacibaculum finnmarkense]MCG8773751.1 hypothetical protein [Tenacibaculum finnmarkense]MCG8836583.1 hypothetical protein [Tenacibaculum finnmarkense]MCG8894665.1 hypothetical protein [Tenacibaculum finnmarkense]